MLNKTPLYYNHCELQGKMVDFAGWHMPVHYTKGIIQEHLAVRERVGLFDVSHMGCLSIEGPGAEECVDYLSTAALLGRADGSVTYTVWCEPSGFCVDDLLVYRRAKEHFLVVANACNRIRDWEHLVHYAENFDVTVKKQYDDLGIIALQGPKALPLIKELFPRAATLARMHFFLDSYEGEELLVSRTGYTGADGVECIAPHAVLSSLWETLLEKGQLYGIEPCGLGARDTLRLEMGYALYGHEIGKSIAPTESVARWCVSLDKGDFLGKEALLALETSGKRRTEYGIMLEGKRVARQGDLVFSGEEEVGTVVSGTFSPSLTRPIATVLGQRPAQESVEVEIRGRRYPAQVKKLPFIHTHSN